MPERFSTGHANMICNAVKTAYTNGVIGIFGGASQPADANSAETGTLLCLITLGSGAFTAGQAANGINFNSPANGVMSKASGETWSGNGLAAAGAGTVATYFRHYANDYVTGASTTAVRYDGAISTAETAELRMSNTTIVGGAPVTINSFTYTPPRA